MQKPTLAELVSLCKRRGFVFQASEIYGGMQGIYDFGTLGVELKNNLKAAWWSSMVYERDDIEGLDAAILTHKLTLRHSGHEATFTDPLVDCRSCKMRFRADHIAGYKCPNCGSADLTEPRPFNLMFRTTIGPVQDSDSFAYLRPETAQSIFTNFRNILDSTNRSLPFGVAQIGKAFRNEITPRNFVFRVREFEQMELEYFVQPGTDEKWHTQWIENRIAWWKAQGVSEDDLVIHHQPPAELAHYAKATTDILFKFPHGAEELEGIANRTDFDLGSHTRSQEEYHLTAKVEANSDSVAKLGMTVDGAPAIPYVIEPSAGVERGFLAVLTSAYHKEQLADGSERIVLRLRPHLAPIKVAIIPLARNRAEIAAAAQSVKRLLQGAGLGRIAYEASGNIGKSYRRHDEIGTPFCITIDFETVGAGEAPSFTDTVTVRDRDTMAQTRVPIAQLTHYLLDALRRPVLVQH